VRSPYSFVITSPLPENPKPVYQLKGLRFRCRSIPTIAVIGVIGFLRFIEFAGFVGLNETDHRNCINSINAAALPFKGRGA